MEYISREKLYIIEPNSPDKQPSMHAPQFSTQSKLSSKQPY